jgi:hypothetical protein
MRVLLGSEPAGRAVEVMSHDLWPDHPLHLTSGRRCGVEVMRDWPTAGKGGPGRTEV